MFGWLLAGIPSDSSTLLDLLGAAGGGVGFGVRRLQWVATSYVFLTAVWHAVGIALGAATALVLAAVAVQLAVLVAGVAAVDGHVRAEAPSLTPTIGRRMWSALWTVGERAHALWGNEAFRCSVWLFAWTAAATAAAAATALALELCDDGGGCTWAGVRGAALDAHAVAREYAAIVRLDDDVCTPVDDFYAAARELLAGALTGRAPRRQGAAAHHGDDVAPRAVSRAVAIRAAGGPRCCAGK